MRFDIHCLQHLALVKVTLTLCKLSDIKRELTWWCYSPEENINRILFTMTKVLSSMDIALLLKKKLLRCFASIVFDYKLFANTLSNGIHYHRLYAAEHFRSMCWTPYGAIDAQKSVESLIRNRKIPMDGRFHLACKYCFKEDILSLWNQMPILQQDWFIHMERSDNEWVDWLTEGYTPSWPNSVEDYHFKEIFKQSFLNSTAVQNLLEMLPPVERHKVRGAIFRKERGLHHEY
ncbi:hypothetical protein CEXT_6671 [Caerostris extrusa]|uniref:Uncharacterized protein n=1 Tax=Caerostris extrusa TaxID=172846 RepID=A0AAV4RAF5_CAEEX|nr:hypothetical protein CEXT_6671 [Caerostris extrusa]